MRRLISVVAVAALMAAMLVASALPAFAQEGHTSCKLFGLVVSGGAHLVVPFGQVVQESAPVSDDFMFIQGLTCEPRP
jgi:hypothetical protein